MLYDQTIALASILVFWYLECPFPYRGLLQETYHTLTEVSISAFNSPITIKLSVSLFIFMMAACTSSVTEPMSMSIFRMATTGLFYTSFKLVFPIFYCLLYYHFQLCLLPSFHVAYTVFILPTFAGVSASLAICLTQSPLTLLDCIFASLSFAQYILRRGLHSN